MRKQILTWLKNQLTETTHQKILLSRVDQRVSYFMGHVGHKMERWLLGVIFFWFGCLKIFGELSASSIIAKSVFWLPSQIMVPFLGIWELLIGICLILPHMQRIAILFLLIRLPGTLMALLYHYDLCFTGSLLSPTIQGQYLLKEISLLGAALVIGGTVRQE